MPIEANVMELHAAEALLQLHCGPQQRSSSTSDIKLEIEGAATLFLSYLGAPDTPSTASHTSPSPAVNAFQSTHHCSVTSRDDNSETNSQSSFDSPVAYKARKYTHKANDKYKDHEPAQAKRDVRQVKRATKVKKIPQRNLFNGYGSLYQPINLGQKKTCEQGTQTDEDDRYQNSPLPEIEKMDAIISKLYAKIHSLESQLKASHRNSPYPVASELDPDVSTDVLQIQQYNHQSNNYKRKSVKRNSSSCNTNNTTTIGSDISDDEWKPEEYKSSKQILNGMLKPKGNEMVPIGEGYASVPARLLKQIDWSSYTGATRKLLTAVFSRRVLATHSLTGKPSPAFPGKPAKKRLEPELVNDIVQIVVERCGVPESVVRTSITTKCADESKMYRSRQQNKKKQQSYKRNQENVPPSPYEESSDDTY